jgi:Flp pilus assembly protein TadD
MARTWTRTPVWESDRALLLQLLSDHPESYRAHWMAGRVHGVSGRLADATRELALARALHPKAVLVYLDAAAIADQSRDSATARALRDSAAVLMRTEVR